MSRSMENVSSSVPTCVDASFTAGVALSSVTAFVSVFGSCGNVLVLLVPLFHSQRKRPSSFLILNLSVADLIVTAIGCPLNGAWLLTKGSYLCTGNGVSFLQYARRVIITFSSTASLLILSVISLERLSVISWPLKHRTLVTVPRLILVSSVVWSLAVAFSIFAAYDEFHDPVRLTAVAGTAVFYVIITLSYVRILMLTARQRTICSELAASGVVIGTRRQAHVEKRMAETMAIVIGVFTLCLVPFTVLRRIVLSDGYGVLYDAFLLLALSHSAANPVIYFYRSKLLRSVLKRIILSYCRCCVRTTTTDFIA